MSLFACRREAEVREALGSGRWPEGCAAELRNHVVVCRVCSDLVLVEVAFRAARRRTAATARLEAPGVVWWRAQLRRRNAALERIEKPILRAQLFALAVITAVGAIALAWEVQQGRLTAWLEDLAGAINLQSLLPSSLEQSDGGLWILVPVLATAALLSGVVVYLASEKQ
jgi:hypothetical protein